MVHAEDDKIVELLRNGATLEQGFRLLMHKYQEKVYWHIRRIVESHEDTDDVLQNTFIKAYRGFDNFEGRSSLFTWLYRIATNEALTHLKNKKSKSTLVLEEFHTGNSSALDHDFDEDKALQKLAIALEGLPEKQRIVFNMRYYDELSYQDMSQILDTSVGALKASYHHAVKKIEAVLLA
ncbi:MAG: RNA polymerase sigma factor [Saprospiraceae bacterium]|nr:RNA polymerase sigma factor [Saprospiraceae bacterium]MBK7787373.1 RNA polymerase sigma factor [Saprospiraceae bacterium]MBK9687762.1 RNA polymerase sigma factor [Saprospiraceae bacterium]